MNSERGPPAVPIFNTTENALERGEHEREHHSDQTGAALLQALRLVLDATPSDAEYHAALQRAYPNPSPELRERVRQWQLDEQEGYETVVDSMLRQLATLHKLMRIAQAERDTWIVEALEERREGIAAEAAVALTDDVLAEHTAQ